jgi:hypothetical protein
MKVLSRIGVLEERRDIGKNSGLNQSSFDNPMDTRGDVIIYLRDLAASNHAMGAYAVLQCIPLCCSKYRYTLQIK